MTNKVTPKSNVYCVIMAGGVGSRFWPLSTSHKPKQFLDILGTGKSLIRHTYERILNFCLSENIYIVTGSVYEEQVLEHLPEISKEQILLEPMRRNTAPCIALANQVIKKRDPNALIVVAPSDHLVLNEVQFTETINHALTFAAQNDALLTIGVTPNRPETGYGYIQITGESDKTIPSLYKVKTFTEKPDLELAKVFLESGEFYWNSGIFVWSLNAIEKAFTSHLPDVSQLFEDVFINLGTDNEHETINTVYAECQSVSVDYGILEKAANVYVICSEFGWSDLGTWGSLYQNSNKNEDGNTISSKDVFTYDVQNTIVNLPKEKVAVIQGLDGYIVAESNGVLLICKLENEQEIKKYQNDVLVAKGDSFI